MNSTERSAVIRFADARRGIPGPAGEHAVLVLQRGTIDVKLSMPRSSILQTPHEQDEIYVIIRGRARCSTTASASRSRRAICCSSPLRPSISTRF